MKEPKKRGGNRPNAGRKRMAETTTLYLRIKTSTKQALQLKYGKELNKQCINVIEKLIC